MTGYCCGCGGRVEIYPTYTKHGEADRYGMRKCSCGSTTASLQNFHQVKPHCDRFKPVDKTIRRTRQLIRNLKRIEVTHE